jgi:hypothetical protein
VLSPVAIGTRSAAVGERLGAAVTKVVGSNVGERVGLAVGCTVGAWVGGNVQQVGV